MRQSRDVFHLLALLTAVVVIATLYFAKVVLVPFALALLCAFLLAPPVTWLQKLHIPRVPAAVFVLALAVALVGAVGWTVTKQVVDVTSQLPNYKTNLINKIDSLRTPRSERLHKATETVKELGRELTGTPELAPTNPRKRNSLSESSSESRPVPVTIVPRPTTPIDSIPNLLGPAGTLLIVVVFTLVMMIRREDLRDRFIRLVGEGHLKTMTEVLDEAARRVSRYLLLQLAVNASFGTIVGLGLHFIGIPNALLWGVISGTLRFLPYIGPPVAASMPILLSLALFQGWSRPLMTIGLFVCMEIIVAYLVEPFLYGAHTGLSSMAVLFAAVFWTVLWGPIGLILSTPLTVCLMVMGRHVPHLSFLQVLLGDEPVLAPETRFYQRLLAMDANEARWILKEESKRGQLTGLYDTVILPALSAIEQDRHRNLLTSESEEFVIRNLKEIIAEQFERLGEKRVGLLEGSDAGAQNALVSLALSEDLSRTHKIVCVPSEDSADELAGTMFAQALEEAGYRAQCVPVNTPIEMLPRLSPEQPDAICISALSPFAIGPVRSLYEKLRGQMPHATILIGLWNFSGNIRRAAKKIGVEDAGLVFTTLVQGVRKTRLSAKAENRSSFRGEEILPAPR